MEFVGVLLLLAFVANGLLALIPASVAANKGRSFGLWWAYGFVLFLAALIHALLAEAADRMPCPHCAESIRPEASLCPHCRMTLEPRQGRAEGGLLYGSEDDALAAVPLERATNLSEQQVLRLIAEHDGNLNEVTERADGDVADAVQRMIDERLLVAVSWDQVTLTDGGREVLAALPLARELVALPAAQQSGPNVQEGREGAEGPEGLDVGGPARNQVWVGSDVAVWDDERFELQGPRGTKHVIDLVDVVTVNVENGLADAWFVFHRQDRERVTVPISRSAVQEARLVATQLQTLVTQRDALA